MIVSRSVSLVVGASIALLLGAPPLAAFGTPSAGSVTSDVGLPSTGGDVVELEDATLESAPQIELDGELLVLISEPALDAHTGDSSDAADEHGDLTSYAVVTDDGTTVPVSGDIPESVASGDEFSGVVAVPREVIDELPATSADAVESSSSDAPVAEDSTAAADVLEAAVGQAIALPVAEASVSPAPLAAAGYAATHELQIVVITPAGTAAPTTTDSALLAVAGQSTGYWSTLSRGLIPSFATNPSITRFSSPTACNNSPTARWNEAAVQLGYANANAYLNAAPNGVERHLLVALPVGCLSVSGPGVASVGASLHQGGVAQIVLGASVDRQVMTHELGHNLSLGHSNLDYCGTDAATAGCTEYAYEDRYDVMGLSIGGWDGRPTTLNSRHQIALGFQAAGGRYSLAAGAPSTTVTTTVGRLDGGAPSIFEIVDPQTSAVYYLEYRAGENGAYYAGNRNAGIGTNRAVNSQPGVRLLRSNASGGSAVLTQSDSNLGGGFVRPYAAAGQSIQSPSGGVRVTVNSASESAGASVTITLSASGASQPVFRFWSPKLQSHFYTSSASERDGIIATYSPDVWTYEGPRFQAFTTQVAGTVPLHRFWSDTLGGHFYTANEGEKQYVIDSYDDAVWAYEGTAFYVYPNSYTATPTLSVARFWSPRNQHHFYTASAEEAQIVRDSYPDEIWTYEMENFRVPAQ